MNGYRIQRWLLCGFCLAALFSGTGGAERPKKPMRESATLPADKNLLKQFGAIEDYLAEKRWAEAIDVLQQIAQNDGRLLVLARPGAAGESAVYLNVATRCNILLSQLPPEGLAAYRRKVDPQARRWLERWKRTHDEVDLERIVRESYLSSVGDDALWALAESAWDRGDLASARQYWTQLVPLGREVRQEDLPTVLRYPDSDLNAAEVLARLVLCTLMEGERDRAMLERDRLRELFPDEQGTLGGRQGPLCDLLTQILDESAAWDVRRETGDTSTFGLGPGRGGALPAPVELGASKWSRPLPSNQLIYPERYNAASDRAPLSYHPVTFEDIVLVNDARSIWAWNLLTGEPAWSTERGTAEIYPPAPDDIGRLPTHVCNGVPYYTMTIADGRLYARMGSVVTNPAHLETGSESELVCLDLAQGQGKLVWKIAAQDLIKGDEQWRFEGSPLVLAGRAYVALSKRQPQYEFAIACLDATTGMLVWHRTVVFARGSVEDHQNRVSHLLLTAGAGKLFLSTDAGAIVAVEARDGRLAWAVTYESVLRGDRGNADRLLPLRSAAVSSHLEEGLLPPVFHEGYLFVAPNDCSRLFCIEAESGRVRWQRKHPDPDSNRWRHLLGVVPGGGAGRLIVSGNALWSIDVATGKTVFGARTNWLEGSPSEQGYGRGVLAGNVILWPTREAIKIVDAQSGTVIGNKPLHTPGGAEVGGNLAVSQGMLLVAQPERLVAYCEYSLLKKRIERALSLRTDPGAAETASPDERRLGRMPTPNLLGLLADVEIAQGNLDAAAGALRAAIKVEDANEPPDAVTSSRYRHRLLDLLRQAARIATSEGDSTVAVERLEEARQLATQPADIVSILMETAHVELARSRPAAAAECWQLLLDDDRLRDVVSGTSTAGAMAEAAIARLIEERGREVYAGIERRASSEILALQRAGDPGKLRRVLHQYPNAQVTAQFRRQLASQDQHAGRYQNALADRARLMERAASPDDRAASLAMWADTLEAAGYFAPAYAAWNQLVSGELAEREIEFANRNHQVAKLARKRLENPVFAEYQSLEPPSAQCLDRAWSLSRTKPVPGERPAMLVPTSNPPAANLACLLLRSVDAATGVPLWDCVDRSSGQVRWSRSLPAALQWSDYSETGLLLATRDQVLAVALEDGRELWTISLAADADRGAAPAAVQFCVRAHWILMFDPQAGIRAIETRTGRVAWVFKPPRGTLQSRWLCGRRQLAVQTLQPAATWLVQVAADCAVTELPGATEPWLQGTFDESGDVLVTISTDRRIDGRSTSPGGSEWKYQGGMSFAHVDPVVWSAGRQLLMTVDGTTLAGIDRWTGRTQWTAGIADRPLCCPAEQVIAAGDAAFVANLGLLRRVSLQYGDCQWERFLGSSAEQWHVSECQGLIAAWSASVSPGDLSPTVAWCDARTGRIVQRLAVAAGERVVDVSGNRHGCLVVTDQRLVAYRTVLNSRQIVFADP